MKYKVYRHVGPLASTQDHQTTLSYDSRDEAEKGFDVAGMFRLMEAKGQTYYAGPINDYEILED